MSAGRSDAEIEVLLATYNGARFLSEQIASVLEQDYPQVRVLARDDGSMDASAKILQHHAERFPEHFCVLPSGSPTGSAAGNFRELLLASDADYVALCDQDDVWCRDKLSRSMEAMRRLEQQHGSQTPLLVFTDLRVVSDDLRTVQASLWRHNRIDPSASLHLNRLLGENVATGCTMLLNRPLAKLSSRMPSNHEASQTIVMHDHWIALVAAAFGKTAWVAEPTVLYRQHDANVVGAADADDSMAGYLKRFLAKAPAEKRQKVRAALRHQAAIFGVTYADLISPDDRAKLEAFARLAERNRLRQVVTTLQFGFWRSTAARNMLALVDMLRGYL